MQQIMNAWASMDIRRRVIIGLAIGVVVLSVIGLVRMASSPSMVLLYAGLESGAAGEVVSALEQRGVRYEVRGGAIFVESGRRDELRMTLASEGLPSNTGKGYELLDGLSGFGTTSMMFDAAYWRAKEGELARTIATNSSVSSARVHIANVGSNPFQRDVRPTASVAVTRNSGVMSPKQARAVQYLVASAVPGLTPEDVSVIDSEGGLIGAVEETPPNTADDRAELLRQKVLRMLEARVGSGNVVVEVSIDTITRSESIRERRIDPESRIAISTDTEERSNQASDQGGGDVTVASNLPQGEAGGGDNSSSQSNETRERINYEVSETERQITQAPGDIRRLTLAVLVNGTTQIAADGTETFVPRSEPELRALEELVASAVGFDESRGDVIALKTMQFEAPEPAGTLAEASWFQRMAIDVTSLVQMAVLGLVALILGLFVVRPLLARPVTVELPQIAPPTNTAISGQEEISALTGEIDNGPFDPQTMALSDASGPAGSTALPELPNRGEDPVERLRALIAERQDETVEILRSWLEGEEEQA